MVGIVLLLAEEVLSFYLEIFSGISGCYNHISY